MQVRRNRELGFSPARPEKWRVKLPRPRHSRGESDRMQRTPSAPVFQSARERYPHSRLIAIFEVIAFSISGAVPGVSGSTTKSILGDVVFRLRTWVSFKDAPAILASSVCDSRPSNEILASSCASIRIIWHTVGIAVEHLSCCLAKQHDRR